MHLRGVVIAGGLAALALALGFVTLAMNQSASHAEVHTVLPLKARHHAASAASGGSASAVSATAKPKPKLDPNLVAALQAGLPRPVARALASTPVAVVQLTSSSDSLAELSAAEAKSGAALAGVSYVPVNVDRDGGAVEQLTRALGSLPVAPATLVYERPAKVFITLTGFNDRTVVQQAVANATPVSAAAVPASAASPAATPVAPSWASQASALCRAAYAKFGAYGGLGAPAKLAASQTKFEAASTSFLTQLAALKAPAGKGAQTAKLNKVLSQAFAAKDAEVAAAARHDAAGQAAAAAKAKPLFAQATTLERQLGATGCVEAAA